MEKLIISTFAFFLILTVYGQNGVRNGHLFIVQKDKKTISINSFANERINEIKSFPISEKSIYTTDQKDRVAILDTARNYVSIHDIKSSVQIELTIPFEIKPKTILLNNSNLFIGGEMGKEILIQYHLESKKWYQLDIPKEVVFYGKAVDDLVINDTLLIAIDNLILPKYILYYHLNSNNKLDFSHYRQLKYNNSYEGIHKARITTKYLGLLSTTLNHGTLNEHITLYTDLDLLKSFAITVNYRKGMTFKDFIILDDKLVIANSIKGLGILDIQKTYFKGADYEKDLFNAQVKENRVNYKKIKNGEIIKLTGIPNEQKIILTIENIKGEIRNEIIEVK